MAAQTRARQVEMTGLRRRQLSRCSCTMPGRVERAARRIHRSIRRFPHRQRCAVRITYSKNTVRGQWRAHGRYLERESAAHGEIGFDAGVTVPVSHQLQAWQANKDPLLWKFIISPEFGERANLQRLTRDLVHRGTRILAVPWSGWPWSIAIPNIRMCMSHLGAPP